MKIPFTNFSLSLKKNAGGENRGIMSNGESTFASMMYGDGIRVAPKDLWRIYRMNADVYSCIREWKQAVGVAGFRLVDLNDEEMDAPLNENEYIQRVFKNSGGFIAWQSRLIRDLGICSNAYFEIVKSAGTEIHSLKRLDPRTIYIIADKHGTILRYYQKVSGSESVKFEVNEILHVVLDEDPDNELLGMSPLETALWEARTDISSAKSNYYFFENDAVPAHIYILDGTVSKEQQDTAFDSIKAQFGGAENKNKSAVMAGVKEIKQVSMTQKDMEFVVGRRFNTEKVCSVYGVPKFMLGYTDGVNYASSTSVLQKFYLGTIQPLESLIESVINNTLLGRLGVTQTVFKYNPQTFGDENEKTQLALTEFISGALTLRQYKNKTAQKITIEDENEPLIDKHILQNGSSATLLEDVGVDPVVDVNDPAMAENMINALTKKFLMPKDDKTSN